MECACCGTSFQKKPGGFKRQGLHTRFKGGASAAQSLEDTFKIAITPGKKEFICDECSLTIRSLKVKQEQYSEVQEKFRKIRKPGTYISTKIPATPTIRHRSSKKRKVISTPVKVSTPKKLSSDKVPILHVFKNELYIILYPQYTEW